MLGTGAAGDVRQYDDARQQWAAATRGDTMGLERWSAACKSTMMLGDE